MNLIISILPEELINAIGWTLIHSLWQISVVALGLAVVLRSMSHENKRRKELFIGKNKTRCRNSGKAKSEESMHHPLCVLCVSVVYFRIY